MKKYLFLFVAAMGMLMTSCKSINVEQGSYPITNAAVQADLRPQFEVGSMVTTTVHFSKIGKFIFKADFDKNKTINCASFGAKFFDRFLDPLGNLRGAIMYKAIEGTNYDVVLGPVYTVERDGIKYTVTMKGYGAKYKGIHQNMGAR